MRHQGTRAQARGARAQALGQQWETVLVQACENYRLQGRADIYHVGPPTRIVGAPRGNLFTVVFTGAGSCDLVGRVGVERAQALPFEAEAKHCAARRWAFKELQEHQAACLDRLTQDGGVGGVLLQLQGRGWWLPWSTLGPRWRSWWEGRRKEERTKAGAGSVSAADCAELGAEFFAGDFLPAVLEACR